jgi:hypothetical protein
VSLRNALEKSGHLLLLRKKDFAQLTFKIPNAGMTPTGKFAVMIVKASIPMEKWQGGAEDCSMARERVRREKTKFENLSEN